MNIRQKERIFFFTHAITILSFFTYSVCDEKVKSIQNPHSVNTNHHPYAVSANTYPNGQQLSFSIGKTKGQISIHKFNLKIDLTFELKIELKIKLKTGLYSIFISCHKRLSGCIRRHVPVSVSQEPECIFFGVQVDPYIPFDVYVDHFIVLDVQIDLFIVLGLRADLFIYAI